MLIIKNGDLFKNLPKEFILPHVVNNSFVMGSGFVIPLKKKFPEVECKYLQMKGCFSLGENQYIHLGNKRIVVNMFAQVLGDPKRNLRYWALYKCMDDFGYNFRFSNLPIIAPKFGSLMAGGNWEFIKELINEIWIDKYNLNVTIFDLGEAI